MLLFFCSKWIIMPYNKINATTNAEKIPVFMATVLAYIRAGAKGTNARGDWSREFKLAGNSHWANTEMAQLYELKKIWPMLKSFTERQQTKESGQTDDASLDLNALEEELNRLYANYLAHGANVGELFQSKLKNFETPPHSSISWDRLAKVFPVNMQHSILATKDILPDVNDLTEKFLKAIRRVGKGSGVLNNLIRKLEESIEALRSYNIQGHDPRIFAELTEEYSRLSEALKYFLIKDPYIVKLCNQSSKTFNSQVNQERMSLLGSIDTLFDKSVEHYIKKVNIFDSKQKLRLIHDEYEKILKEFSVVKTEKLSNKDELFQKEKLCFQAFYEELNTLQEYYEADNPEYQPPEYDALESIKKDLRESHDFFVMRQDECFSIEDTLQDGMTKEMFNFTSLWHEVTSTSDATKVDDFLKKLHARLPCSEGLTDGLGQCIYASLAEIPIILGIDFPWDCKYSKTKTSGHLDFDKDGCPIMTINMMFPYAYNMDDEKIQYVDERGELVSSDISTAGDHHDFAARAKSIANGSEMIQAKVSFKIDILDQKTMYVSELKEFSLEYPDSLKVPDKVPERVSICSALPSLEEQGISIKKLCEMAKITFETTPSLQPPEGEWSHEEERADPEKTESPKFEAKREQFTKASRDAITTREGFGGFAQAKPKNKKEISVPDPTPVKTRPD
jgi:hypothetical protein